jgi:hypothetical protein
MQQGRPDAASGRLLAPLAPRTLGLDLGEGILGGFPDAM